MEGLSRLAGIASHYKTYATATHKPDCHRLVKWCSETMAVISPVVVPVCLWVPTPPSHHSLPERSHDKNRPGCVFHVYYTMVRHILLRGITCDPLPSLVPKARS